LKASNSAAAGGSFANNIIVKRIIVKEIDRWKQRSCTCQKRGAEYGIGGCGVQDLGSHFDAMMWHSRRNFGIFRIEWSESRD
jgi:hypothetical protein